MKKILVADDDSLLLETLLEYLTEVGFFTYGCTNNIDFAKALATNKFDFIICDFKLPKFCFKREFSLIFALESVPALILTTADPDCIDYYPRDHKYLPKPFNMANLCSLLD